jgi:hypothetical protein
MLIILTSKILMRIVEKGEHGINMCCRMVFYIMLISSVFQLISFAFYFVGSTRRWFDGTFWSEEN